MSNILRPRSTSERDLPPDEKICATTQLSLKVRGGLPGKGAKWERGAAIRSTWGGLEEGEHPHRGLGVGGAGPKEAWGAEGGLSSHRWVLMGSSPPKGWGSAEHARWVGT